MKIISKIACVSVIIGGLNWGLVGLLSLDLVAKIFGVASGMSKLVYILVGLSAVIMIFSCPKKCCNHEQK